MLNVKQLNQVESLFLAIDSKKIDSKKYFLVDEIISMVYYINPKQCEYLLWLLNRWVLLRKDKTHLPTRYDQ